MRHKFERIQVSFVIAPEVTNFVINRHVVFL